MDDDRCLLGAVLIHIGQFELRRQAEVKLAGGKCVLSADCGLHIDIQLRAVEGSLTDLFRVVDLQFVENLAQRIFRCVPHLIVVMILLLVFRITQRQHAAVICDLEVLVCVEDQIADTGDLALDLIRRHKQVRVILAEMTSSLDALQGSGRFISEIMRDLADTKRQVPVGSRTVRIDPHMMRAVHRTKHILFILNLHGREHIVLVVIPVAGCPVQIDRSDTGGHDMQIAQAALLVLDIILKDLPQGIALRQEHRKSLANQVIGHEELHLLTDLSVIAGFSFFLLDFPGFQLLAVVEGNAVDTGQHLVLAVVLPVSAGLTGDLECLECFRIGKVRADAHVDVITLLIECDPRILSQVSDMLDLIDFSPVLHQLDRF